MLPLLLLLLLGPLCSDAVELAVSINGLPLSAVDDWRERMRGARGPVRLVDLRSQRPPEGPDLEEPVFEGMAVGAEPQTQAVPQQRQEHDVPPQRATEAAGAANDHAATQAETLGKQPLCDDPTTRA